MIANFIGMIKYENENTRHAVNELLSAHGKFETFSKRNNQEKSKNEIRETDVGRRAQLQKKNE